MDKEIRPFTYVAPGSQKIVYGERTVKEMARRESVLKLLERAEEAKRRLFQKPTTPKPKQLGFDL
jgi:hypothetical protein